MTKEEAIKLIEQLLEANMVQGQIKNFATLDKLREAVMVLRKENESHKTVKKK